MPALSARPIRMFSAFIAMTLAVTMVYATPAHAAGLIRDAETEYMMRTFSDPIFRAAGLDPKAVRIHLVNDSSLNAFVAGGQRMFLHTGLIQQSDRPNMLIGVIAHETGHMAGGHLSRTQQALKSAAVPIVVSTLLGIGAIVAGAGDAGFALITGGQTLAQRDFLSYSRVQEASADQAAVTYLDQVGWSGRGMMDTFYLFRGQEVLSERQQDPYLRSHPLSTQRLSALEDRVLSSPFVDVQDPPEWIAAFEMIKAKLHGFIDRPAVTFRRYPTSDTSIPARYARAVAYHKLGDIARALGEIEPLLIAMPNNPFVWELKGQVLFESGKIEESVGPYRRAVELAPGSPLLHVGLAQSLIGLERRDETIEGLQHLEIARRTDKEDSRAYHQAAIAYARLGDYGNAELSTAERFYVLGQLPRAKQHAARAQVEMDEGTPGWLRAEDILKEKPQGS
ncbi:M48 family metalloprotease [Parvibaculaceae bacterium PLY_AMNH_Bact1]|nr:M48 family metalloprotease [Parvibaculaceae bacterium PLY_AMNH_Bact1]